MSDDQVLELLQRIDRRLDVLERQVLELVRRGGGAAAKGAPPAAVVPVPRKRIDGKWHSWGGEGTGWVPDW